jgi:hypothetical protein
MNAKYFYLLPLLLSALSLNAQQACLDFEDFPVGPAFGPVLNNTPGDTLFEQDGLIAIAREIVYANGNTGFGNATIEGTNTVQWLDENFLFMGNNALELNYPDGVQQVCFDFFDGGGEENLAVNGSDVAVLTVFPDVAGLDFPGVDITVSMDSTNNNTFLSQGTLCITGEVFSLTVGGQEFGVDNVCATPFDEPNTGDCLAFEAMDTLGYGAQAGTPPGTVFYTETGVDMRLAPVQTLFWASLYGDLLVRQENSLTGFTQASGQFLEFASINSIYDLTAYPEPVEKITVDYYYAPNGDGTINFAANGTPFLIQFLLQPGFYALAPGVTLEVVPGNNTGSTGQLLFEGNIQSLLIGGVSGLHIDNVCINPPPPCGLQELIVDANDCDPNGVFGVNIDIEYDGLPSDTLKLFTNGNYQLYTALEFPVTLGPFTAPIDELVFEVAAFTNPDCSLTQVLPAQDCGLDCTLESVALEDYPECLPGDDFYTINVLVEGAQVGDTLTISAQQTNYTETVVYNGQQLILDLPVAAEQFEVLQICDPTANAECCKELSYDFYCPDCLFENLAIEYLPCDGDSLFSFELDFDALGNLPSASFNVETSNGFLGTYAYTDLPVTVGPVLGYGEPVTVWAYDTEGNCGASQTIITPDCLDGCVLGDVNLLIPAAGCNDDGTYNIPMTIENAQNGDQLKITSLATGFSQILTYGEPFNFNLQLSDWPAPGFGSDSLSICFTNQPDCCTYVAFEVPCDPVGCGLSAQVEVIDCQPNGVLTFAVTTTSNTPNPGPFVMINIGDFQYGLVGVNTTVEVGPVINPGVDELIVFVEQWGNQSANSVICEVGVPVDVSNCNPDCDMPAFEVFPEGCNGNFGSYTAFVDLDEAALNGAPVDIYVNGDLQVSEYTGGGLSLDIWAINPGDVQDVVSVCFSDNPECCISKGIDALPCYCTDIIDIVAEATPCDEGSYYVTLDLVTVDFGDAFGLEVNNEFYGSYFFDELPVTIGPFVGDGLPLSLFAYPTQGNCEAAGTSVETPFCDGGCALEGSHLLELGCNEDFYTAVIQLDGTVSVGDTIFVTSEFSDFTGVSSIGPADNGVFTITMPNTQEGFDLVTICVGNQSDCCIVMEYDLPCGNQGCDIEAVVAETTACNDDGEYSLVLDLEYFGVPTSFEVTIPELGFSAVYGLGEFPISVPGLPGDGGTYQVNIGATDCNAFTEILFEAPACTIGCVFNNVIAEPHPCEDGTFLVDIEVQVNDPGDLGYFIFADGEIFGPYDYSEPFVTLGPFAGDGVTVYDFLILDFANPTCFGYVEVGPKSCDDENDCQILELSAIPQGCNGDGTYDLLLDIQVEEPQDDLLFWFYINGDYAGQSTLAALPGLLINIPLVNAGEVAAFKACIFDQPDCCIEVDYPQPDCSPNNCPVDNVTVDFAFCDTTGFYVELDFDSPSPNTAGSYRIFGNGEIYDTLGYNVDRPIIVGPFDPYTDNIYQLIVADLQQPNCSDFVDFPAFDCEEGQEVCIDFSAFDGFTAAGGGSGGVIGTESGVEVAYEALPNNFPTALEVADNPYPAFAEADGSVLIFSNAKAGFEVGSLPGTVSSRTMTMDFHFPTWVDSIQVFANGEDFDFIYLPLPTNPGEVQLGDDITLGFDYSTPATTGKITVEGPIESLYFSLLPNYTMVLDNLCITNVVDESCGIENVEAEALGCDADGKYKLFLDFEVQNPGNDFFDLYDSEGNLIDFFALGELPLELEGFGLADGSQDSLTICINDNPDCCVNVAYEVPDCDNLTGCLDFDAFAGFSSSPNDGGQGLLEVGADAGVQFKYAIADFCECAVNVVPSDNIAFFDAASGEMVEMKQADLQFEFAETAIEVSFDYSTEESVLYYKRDGFPVGGFLDTLPINEEVTLPDGTTIEKTLYSNGPASNSAKITLRGELDRIQLEGDGFIDNLCWTPATEEVWPGDANADNLAHHIDLLYVGLGYGVTGPARTNPNSSWNPAAATDWDSTFVSGTNYKHTDCNGDGIIDENDGAVIEFNYGLAHGVPEPITELPGTDLDPPAFIDFPVDQPSGATFQAPIILGAADAPVQDAYGVAFTVQFDPEVISPEQIEVVYPTSWFGEPGVNTLTIDKVYADGRIEIALTRIDQNNVSGHGQVAYIIGIIDDIAGLTDSKVSVEHVFCIDTGEDRLPVQGRETNFKVVSSNEPDAGTGVFSLFPNPATDWVNIVSPHGFEADQVQLLNMNGQELPVQVEDNRRLSLANLPSGVYLVRITTGRSIVHKRIVKE